jgi:hypothetical protein
VPGVTAVPPDEAVVVHFLKRAEIPERAVNPAPLPCIEAAMIASGRVLPGFQNAASISVLPVPEVV